MEFPCLICAASLLLGCASVVDPGMAEQASTGGNVAASSSSSAFTTSSESGRSASTARERGGDESGCAFLCPEDTGSASECSIWLQNCPSGNKCTSLDADGDWLIGDTRCVPVVPDPAPAGAACSRPGPGEVDVCELGTVCWDTADDTAEGTCMPFCAGTLDDAFCSDPSYFCSVNGSGTFSLCIPRCDPLDPLACEDGRGCYRSSFSGFACEPDQSGDGGGPLETCSSDNECNPGSGCVDAEDVGLCNGKDDACCVPWCDVKASNCPLQTVCAPYSPVLADPGNENLGVCLGL